jgi:hypothetical protein
LLISPPFAIHLAFHAESNTFATLSQAVIVIALRDEIEEMPRAFDDALRVTRPRGNVHSDRTFDHHVFIEDLKFDFQAGELGPGVNSRQTRIPFLCSRTPAASGATSRPAIVDFHL